MQTVAAALVPVTTGLLAVPVFRALSDAALFAIVLSGLALLGQPAGTIYAFDSVLLSYLVAFQAVLLSYAIGVLVYGNRVFQERRGWMRAGWLPVIALGLFSLAALMHAIFPDSVALFVIYVILVALSALGLSVGYGWWLRGDRAEGFYWLFLMLVYLVTLVICGSLQYTQTDIFVPMIVLVCILLAAFLLVAVLYWTAACTSCAREDGYMRAQATDGGGAKGSGDDSKQD